MTTPITSKIPLWRTIVLVVLVAVLDVLASFLVIGLGLETGTVPSGDELSLEAARFMVAPLLAPLGAVALFWRHRFPRTVAAVTAVLGAASLSGVAFFIALFLLAKRRLDWWVAAVAALCIAAEMAFGMEPVTWGTALMMVVTLAAVAGWGAYRGQRARLMESMKERAVQAEATQVADVERSKLAERHRIAREMHDTLAHRMSLLAVQAGALQVAAPDGETAESARLMRQTAHDALEELREVLGVLHDDSPAANLPANHPAGDGAIASRQGPPGIPEIQVLVAEWREAGVEVDCRIECGPGIPDAISRAAHRVAQEGITNAVRHAPGGAIALGLQIVSGSAGEPGRLEVSVQNTAGSGDEPALGARRGLIGLQERVELLGGTLRHGPLLLDGGPAGFSLSATIPLQRLHVDESL